MAEEIEISALLCYLASVNMLLSDLEYHYISRIIIWKGETQVMSTGQYHLHYAFGKDDC